MIPDLDLPTFADERYRYWLRREIISTGRRALFVMLNPSTADAHKNDPTMRNCLAIGRAHQFGVIGVVNLFALRNSKPEKLWSAVGDRVGPHNDVWLSAAASWAEVVICAWGSRPSRTDARAVYARRVSAARGIMAKANLSAVHVLGFTEAGDPRHPRWWRDHEAELVAWRR